MQPTGVTNGALAAGADSSSDRNDNGSISDHNFGIKKKRPCLSRGRIAGICRNPVDMGAVNFLTTPMSVGFPNIPRIYDRLKFTEKKQPRDSMASPATLGIKKKRRKDCKRSPKATVVVTHPYSFHEKVHKFTGMPTPPASSTSEESERRPLLFKSRAQRAEINVPLTTFPALSSALMNSTYCCNFPLADHLPKLPVTEGDHPVEIYTSNPGDQTVEICTSNPMLPLPTFSDYKASNQQSGESVSLLFEELWEELGLTEIAVI